MPYIKPEDKKKFSKTLEGLPEIENAGQLNYLITCIVRKYLRQWAQSYSVYNEAMGALECCKLELYRRMIAPYEDKKIKENGDVYSSTFPTGDRR